MTDKYPHWKDALLGNGTVANLRCAVKYGFWHLAYGLLLILGVVLLAGAWLFDKATGTSAVGRVQSGLGHPYIKKASRVGAKLFVAAYLTLGIGVIVWEIIKNPIILAWGIGLVVALIVAFVVGVYVWERTRAGRQTLVKSTSNVARRAGERAVETPGVRRVYGNCPVHLDIEPKWVERVTQAFD